MPTIFEKIVAGEIPATIVHQDDRVTAFRDISPQAPVHVLVIPRTHVATLNDTSDAETLGRMLLMARTVAKQEGVDEAGYRTVINTNGAAGQTVFHLHAHVLGKRHLAWPPG